MTDQNKSYYLMSLAVLTLIAGLSLAIYTAVPRPASHPGEIVGVVRFRLGDPSDDNYMINISKRSYSIHCEGPHNEEGYKACANLTAGNILYLKKNCVDNYLENFYSQPGGYLKLYPEGGESYASLENYRKYDETCP